MNWCKIGLHKNKLVYEGGHDYYQCERCGRRWILRGFGSTFSFGYVPGTSRWLNGEFETMEQAYEASKEEMKNYRPPKGV